MSSESSPADTGSLDNEKPEPARDIESPVTDSLPIEISWDSEDDPANPQNWSTHKKTLNVGIVSTLAFITYALILTRAHPNIPMSVGHADPRVGLLHLRRLPQGYLS